MRVAAIYDIHGNLPALEAVLEDIRNRWVDRVVVGGDVFPGPMGTESLHSLLSFDIPVDFIQGNGDREVLAIAKGFEPTGIPEQFRETMRWAAEQLQQEDREVLGSWPQMLNMQVDGIGKVLFCHATPNSDTQIFTRLTTDERVQSLFSGVAASLVVCGHTHMQFDRVVGGIRIVNTGSVGMPFGNPGAYWLLLGPDIELCRSTYELSVAAERIRATRYPQAEIFAVRNVLTPPSEEEMLQAFARAELK
jgi:predicted phosphodiesterase